MDTANDRFKAWLDIEKPGIDYIAAKTGISAERLKSVRYKKTEMRASEIQALKAVCPEYCYWLATGEELPECGQISPITKQECRAKEDCQ